jgi:transcriptional regulator with XRE-family HTH domain
MSRPNNADTTKRFSKNLMDIMHCIGITGATLATRTGLTPAAISQILRGKREPLLSTAEKIALALGCDIGRLLR